MRQHEGWHRALDAQMDTHRFYSSDLGLRWAIAHFDTLLFKMQNHAQMGNKTVSFTDREESVKSLVHHLIVNLHMADTIYVTSDMQQILMQAAHDLPDDVEVDDKTLISKMGFCLFEEPMVGKDKHDVTITFHALLWELSLVRMQGEDEAQPCIALHFLTDPNDMQDEVNQELTPRRRAEGEPIPPLDVCHFFPLFPGHPVPSLPQPIPSGVEVVHNMLKMFVAMQLLAQQRIGEPRQMAPPRHIRKRAIKWDMNNERYVTLITLRRKSVKRDDHEPEKIERTHRWVVRGHWRRQWYPKSKTHDWKYIYEHIKGPEDAPLIISERRIFNFRR